MPLHFRLAMFESIYIESTNFFIIIIRKLLTFTLLDSTTKMGNIISVYVLCLNINTANAPFSQKPNVKMSKPIPHAWLIKSS